MSWDIYIAEDPEPKCPCGKAEASLQVKCCYNYVCPACGEVWPDPTLADVGNYTSNTAGMLQAAAIATETITPGAYVGDDFSGKRTTEIGPKLDKCIAWMREHRAEMEKMEPPNGWGHFHTYIVYLQQWADACREHDGKVVISM
jgi:hypothetical protein